MLRTSQKKGPLRMVKSFGMVVLQALEVDFYLLDNVFWVSDTTLNGNG